MERMLTIDFSQINVSEVTDNWSRTVGN